MRIARSLLLFIAAVGMLALTVAAPVTSTDLETNRRLLVEVRATDPEQYARLRLSYDRWRALPAERQERLRRLDRQLHGEDSQTQARLMRVLGEYAAWLTRLPEADQQRIEAAASTDEKLQVVRELRDRQWRERLPAAQQAEYRAAPAERKPALLAQWREEERRRERDWADARAPWQEFGGERPLPVDDLKQFVASRLAPMLTPDEMTRLSHAQDENKRGTPMMLFRTIVELSDKHPLLAPDDYPKYKTFDSLPEAYKKAIHALPNSSATRLRTSAAAGRWPDYAIEITDTLRQHKLAPAAQLGPAKAKEFGPELEQAIDQLKEKLSSAERLRLKTAEGKWPEYPKTLHELAREHKYALPGLSLPGDPHFWHRLRTRRLAASGPLPEPPAAMLQQFTLKLAQQDPDGPRLSLADPHDRELLKARFFESRPDLLERLRNQDRVKMEGKVKARPPAN